MANSRKQNLKRILVFFLLLTNYGNNAEIRLINSGYENIIVEMSENIPIENCGQILIKLETMLTSASHHLYIALDGRAYFRKIIIILPDTWPDECATALNRTILASTGEKSDVKITETNYLFGDRIWTKQSSGCGIQGQQIFMSYLTLNSPTISKEFVKEWAKYRYGVFDEIGYDGDNIYPKCYFTDGQHITGCTDANVKDTGICQNGSPYSDLRKILDKRSRSSLMFVPQADHITRFCDQITHDRYAPTKHNLLCERRSTLEVILKHKDFVSGNNINGGKSKRISTIPIFHYRRRELTRYIIVLDETQDALIRESWSFMRSAIRKWVLYDLLSNTEIGIVLVNNTEIIKSMEITSLEQQSDRDLIASYIPYVASDARQSACIKCGVKAAVNMLLERRRTNGFSSDVILIIAPGMDSSTDYKELANYAIQNNIKISTINYPAPIHKQPMDKLAELTSGLAFTVFEHRYNGEKSSLDTYFELCMVLFSIGNEFYEGLKSLLPTEIHRKRLVDVSPTPSTGARITRVINGSFYVDDNVRSPVGFFLYTHNVELPLIETFQLFSPTGIAYITRSDQRMPVKQLTLIAVINATGTWTYLIDRFNGNPQPHFVQVIATPLAPTVQYFNARAWYNRSSSRSPLILFCEILYGEYPVHSAMAEVTVIRLDPSCNPVNDTDTSNNNCTKKFRLLDTGSGDPDITKGDGIYSHYFSAFDSGPGIYKFDITVDDNSNTAYALTEDSPYLDMPCCGSVIPTTMTSQTIPFQRYLPPITIHITHEDIENELKANTGRIGDLTVDFVENGYIRLAWTAPDMGGRKVAYYDIKYALTIQDIVDNFETATIYWDHDKPQALSPGDETILLIDISKEPHLFGQAVFFAIRPYSKLIEKSPALPGPISNPVRTFIPINAKPPNNAKIPNTDSTISDSSDGSKGDNHDIRRFDGNNNDNDDGDSDSELDIKLKYAIPIFAVLLCLLCVTIMYCIVCMIRQHQRNTVKKKERKQNDQNQDDHHDQEQEQEQEQEATQQQTSLKNNGGGDLSSDNSINNINQDNSIQSYPVNETDYSIKHQQKQQKAIYSTCHQRSALHSPIQSYAIIESVDHHTIGIPIYNDADGQKSLQSGKFHQDGSIIIDDQQHQPHSHQHHHHHQQPHHQHHQHLDQIDHIEVIASSLPPLSNIYSTTSSAGVSIISTNNCHTLPRQIPRTLSPYESWTASQLLHEHERRISPLEELTNSNSQQYMSDRASLNGGTNAGGGAPPPVPPLPTYTADTYQSLQKPSKNFHSPIYGLHTIPSSISASSIPPTYSTISRTHQQKHHPVTSSSVQGSMNSVNSSNVGTADKRRRNVTMV